MTGGAGFIGSHVVDCLVERGHAVVVLDDLSGGLRENVHRGARLVEGSCTDAPLVDALFARHRFDFVFHLAAYAAEGLSHFIRRFNYTNNVVGSANVVNGCVRSGVRCLVFASSIAVYGRGEPPMTEALTPRPEDPYGIAKYAVELDLAAARALFGLDFVVLRLHNVYGERQNLGDRYRNVIGIFLNQIMQGKPCTIFGDGEQTRAFTHIADVAPVIADAVERPAARGETFNLGADRAYSVNELATTLQRVTGRDTGILRLDARHEVVHAFCDHSKAKRVLGFEPRVPLEEGLRRMAAWALSVGPQPTRTFHEIEVEKNLPASWRDAAAGPAAEGRGP